MNRIHLILLTYCAVGLSLNSFAADYAGQAVSISGKVLVRNAATQSMQMNFLKPGDKIEKGSIINTGSDGSAKLLMTDKTILDLGPSSLFKVNDYALNSLNDRKVDISLDYGQVRASVNQPVSQDKGKFTIRTKAATMGVRGTEFVIQAGFPPRPGEPPSIQQTQLTVIKGSVDLADLNTNVPPVSVTAGMLASKGITTPPQIIQLDSNQIKVARSEAVQKDMTFMQAVSVDQNSTQSSEKKDAKGNESGPERGGKQTLKNMSTNVESQVKLLPPPTVADMKLPGIFSGFNNFDRPIDFLNGRPVSLQVKFCPNGC